MGDIVVKKPGKNQGFKWISRVDKQVKIRGIRVELAEIERNILYVLSAQDGVVVTCLSWNDFPSLQSSQSSDRLDNHHHSKDDRDDKVIVLFLISSLFNKYNTINTNATISNSNNKKLEKMLRNKLRIWLIK